MVSVLISEWLKNSEYKVGKQNLIGKTVVAILENRVRCGRDLVAKCSDGTIVWIIGGYYSTFEADMILNSNVFSPDEKAEYIRLIEKEKERDKRSRCVSEYKEYKKLKEKFEGNK